MTPVFDRSSELVGWFDSDNLFDLNLDWVAFNSGGNFFSSSNLQWLGPFEGGSLNDTNGRPVAWLDGQGPGWVEAPKATKAAQTFKAAKASEAAKALEAPKAVGAARRLVTLKL